MQEWSLPPAMQARHREAARALNAEFGETAHDLLRGGHWRNFQSRYPESNRLHKRMLRASARLARAERSGDAGWSEARTHLWRAQCNCPYWHGVFGGLYLPHLRSAVGSELIAAESWNVAEPRLELGDLDLDGAPDALLETPGWAAWIGARGGSLWAFDDRRARWNWGDTVAQRHEFYHRDLAAAEVGGGEGATIHAGVRLKEPGLIATLEAYDPRGRESFRDRWVDAEGEHDLGERAYTLRPEAQAVVLALAAPDTPAIEKRFAIGAGGDLEVRYTLRTGRVLRGTLVVEMNLALHVPDAPDRWIEVGGAKADPPAPVARAEHERVSRVAFVDDWAGRRLTVVTDRPATLRRAPVETVSLSEGGAERVFQGVEARWSFPVALVPGAVWSVTFQLEPRSRESA
jgi:alpha-amylase